MPFNFQQLEQLIAKNRTGEVIDTLVNQMDNIPKHLKSEIIQLSARWKSYKEQSRKGIEDANTLGVEKRQIEASLLDLLSELNKETGEGGKSWSAKSFNWKKVLITAVVIIAALAGIAEITGLSIMGFLNKKPGANEKISTIDTGDSKQDSSIDLSNNIVADKAKEPNSTGTEEKGKTVNQMPSGAGHDESFTLTSVKPTSLSIVCKTNKGIDNLLFTSDETMRVFYKVNRPCFLRVIYKLADNQLVLFENDRQINQEEVGKELELGDGYEAAEPFGKESLYFFVQNEKFPKLKTELSDDGYLIIKDDLKTSLSKTRGMKKKKYFAEYEIKLTTQL